MSTSKKRINPIAFLSIVNLLESTVPAFASLALVEIITNYNNQFNILSLFFAGVISSLVSFVIRFKSSANFENFFATSLWNRIIRYITTEMMWICSMFALTFVILSWKNNISVDENTGALLLMWVVLSIVVTMLLHICIAYLFKRWHDQGAFAQVIAIVGAGKHADRLVKWLKVAYPASIEVVGVFDDRRRERAAELPLGQLVQGTIDDLLLGYRGQHIDRVFVALPHAAEERLLHILRKLRPLPADITLAPDLVAFAAIEESGQNAKLLPLFDVYARPLKAGEQLAKAILDRVVAASLIVFLLPIFLTISFAIALESPGPIVFRQPRYGLGHSIITVFKFRTMYAEFSDYRCGRQTQIDDMRTTRIGRWLRRTSLDELPQLFNVFRGDMSLVGPRPLAIEMRVEDKLNQDLVSEYCLRHRIKPGITGWAQICGLRGAIRSREALQRRVEYDLYYIDNWSFWLDIKIILLTAVKILKAENAY